MTYLSTLSPATRTAYAKSYRAFERWHGSPVDAVLESGAAFYQITREWKVSMEADGLMPRTIQLRLAALRGLAMHAHHTGTIGWLPSVPSVRLSAPDVSGPAPDQLGAWIKKAKPRDALILGILGILGLRASEARMLDLAHVDRASRTLSVKRKGKGNAPQPLGYPEELDLLLTRWLAVRGIGAGPLFTSTDKHGNTTGKRLGEKGFYNVVAKLGTHPHALRHTAITTAMRAAGGAGIPIEDVRAFSAHSDMRTMMIYRDATEDMQGVLAGMVAKRVIGGRDGARQPDRAAHPHHG